MSMALVNVLSRSIMNFWLSYQIKSLPYLQ